MNKEEAIEKKYKILVIDDEKDNLDIFIRRLGTKFNLIAAGSAEEALKSLKQEPTIGVVVSDQRMPKMTGVELLEKVKIQYPEKVRVLITGYTDLNVAIDSINKGDVFKYIQKPIEEDKTFEILCDALGKYTETLNILQDIVETKKKLKERFIEIYESVASGIAHHINNGLVPTKTFFDLLPMKLEKVHHGKIDDDFFDDFAKQAVKDLINVIKIVEMFTWVRNCKVEDFYEQKVEELIAGKGHGVEEVLTSRKIGLEKNLAKDLPSVIVDRMKAQEMISLLIKNCAKEAPEGSKVKISAENGAGSVKIKISRMGPMYHPEEIPRLFDPFYKFDKALKDGVSGLDLTNCFIIAAKHGSEIKVKSDSKETSFSVELPTSKA